MLPLIEQAPGSLVEAEGTAEGFTAGAEAVGAGCAGAVVASPSWNPVHGGPHVPRFAVFARFIAARYSSRCAYGPS